MFGFARRSPQPPGEFDTALSPVDEDRFQRWRATLPPNLQSTDDYDLRGAFKANAEAAANGHLPDTFKKPNHPTFSAESQYSGKAGTGGSWVEIPGGGWLFFATPDNLRYRSADDLKAYFERVEPDSRLVLPLNPPQ